MIPFSFTLLRTREFGLWYETLPARLRLRIDARLHEMRKGHFGVSRSLGDGLFELKWTNGMRVYFSRKRIRDVDMIVLWGGFKGAQGADISKSRRLKARYEHEIEEEGREAP